MPNRDEIPQALRNLALEGKVLLRLADGADARHSRRRDD
jgi:hypothetical protein